MKTIKAILDIIHSGKRFLVASHEGPDGDAIASTLAFANALREMGKDVVAYNQDQVPVNLCFLPGASEFKSDLSGELPFDAGFILDAGELRRAGNHLRDVCKTLVNIDHHPHSEPFGSVHYVDEIACATGILIYRILKEAGHPISLPVATCVYTAILSDTGSFRYSNSNPEAFATASELVAIGLDTWGIASNLYESQDFERLRLLGMALQTLTVSPCTKFASISVTAEMLEKAGAGAEHTDGFVNYPRSVRGVEVALFFRQVSAESFKVGFRSRGTVDVGALSRALGGGGHHNAAGALVSGTLEEVRSLVFSRLKIPTC